MYSCENEVNLDRNTPSASSSSDTSSIGSSLSSSPTHSTTPNKYVYSTPYTSNTYYHQQYYQNNQPNINLPSISTLINNNNSFEDSNYYSRNNSISLNESCKSIISSSVANHQSKPKLKFSIESILGLDNNRNENLDQEVSHSVSVSRKRKSGVFKNSDGSDPQDNSNKRMRTIFTQEQLDALEMEFMRQQYMVGSERSYLASALNLTESQVKIWFQNRRIKWRKSQSGGNQNATNGSTRLYNNGDIDQSFDSDCE